MSEPVVSAFLAQGIAGAVALVAMLVAYAVYRAREATLAELVKAHTARTDDMRTLLVECTKALTANAEAGRDQAEAMREVRDALRGR